MRQGSGQIFPIVMLALLAGLSFYLQTAIEHQEPARDGKLRHDPDAQAENFSLSSYDDSGRLKYRLVAPFMQHFPDDDSSLVRAPTLTGYRQDAPPVVLEGKQAKISNQGKVIYLWDDVLVRRAATAERAALVARMNDLTVQANDGTAFTDSPVDIALGDSWLKGVGMRLDNNASTLVLQSQVTGLFYRSKGSP